MVQNLSHRYKQFGGRRSGEGASAAWLRIFQVGRDHYEPNFHLNDLTRAVSHGIHNSACAPKHFNCALTKLTMATMLRMYS